MRKTFWTPMILAAVTAGSLTTMWVAAQPADTVVPPPSTAPVGGMNAMSATAPTTAPTTQEALTRLSYYLGYSMGENFKTQEVQIDITSLNAGLTDVNAGTPSRFSQEDLQSAEMTLRVMMMERERVKSEAATTKSKAEADAFFAQNKTQPGVKVTASGLQYHITTEGTGAAPGPSDTVKVHYTGKLLDGTTFDSSLPSGQPLEIPLDRVIPGWSEGMQLFKVGSKGTLWIPGELAYGQNPPPGSNIPPGATLAFEIEMLGTTPASTQPTGMIPGMPNLNTMPEPMPTTTP